MPLYEYHCTKCDQTFEQRQRFDDAPLESHDGCGGPVERLLSAPTLQFKGTGWYVTDYGKEKR
jgi:putative FmdB family regulatory protein